MAEPILIEPHAPEVEVFYSCTTNPGTVQLVCLISGFNPKALTVEWLVDGEHGLLHSDLNPVTKDTDGRTYSIRSNASVPQSEWLAGKTYTCQVYHAGTDTTKQAHARKCEEKTTSPSDIQVFLVPPSPADLYVNQSPMLTCLVVNLPSNSSLQVVWSREKPGSIVPEPMNLTEQFNSTITASSSMPILTHDWEDGENFTCTVNHSNLTSPLIKSISKKPEVIVSGEFCNEDGDKELDGLWSTISVFITLFLLSVCYSATVTLFKVKWLFSTVVQLKQTSGPEYKNVIQRVV
ncbi:hypothetical protein KIL84_009839 [Mauremys mutica]|uniref:Ig-like domain-containing protein n=1 Tax=Mauremys mutica TaxID=74926 RepID=A0A9D4B6E8_9SAUR|nr:hypothetical protein KIL84_009839 [Mauremys mutica]